MSAFVSWIIGSLVFGFTLEGFDALFDWEGPVTLKDDEGFSVIEALALGAAWGVLVFLLTVGRVRWRARRGASS